MHYFTSTFRHGTVFTSPRVNETRGNSTHGVWPNRQTPNITPLSLISSINDAGLASLLSVITRRCLFRPFVLSASLLWPTNRSGTTPKSISADLLPQLLTLTARRTHFTTHISSTSTCDSSLCQTWFIKYGL